MAYASLRLLWTRRFGTFWIASLLSNIGTWAQQIGEPWLLLSIGASPFLLGLDAFALNAPAWALTLLGGTLADRADRRRVILWFQLAQMLCPALLVVLVLTQAVRPWEVVARGGLSIGNLATGAASQHLGTETALLVDGLLTVAAQLVLARLWLYTPEKPLVGRRDTPYLRAASQR